MSLNPKEPSRFDLKRVAPPILLFLIALLLRLPGLGWGLKDDLHNQSFHPDEEMNWHYSQQIHPAQFKFTPNFYSYGTLYLTMLRVSSDVVSGYGTPPTSPDTDWDFIRKCETAGRWLSLLAGCGLCVVGYFAARRVTTELGAIMTGVVLAVVPGLVVHSHFATVDVMATFFCGLVGLFSLKLLGEGTAKEFLKWSIAAGVFAGLAMGTKYTAGIAILMPLVALALAKPPKAVGLFVGTIVSCIVAFLIATPGFILESKAFWRDFNFETSHAASGHGTVFAATSPGFLYQLANLVVGNGLILVVLGLCALAYAAYRRARWAFVLLAFLIPYYLVIGRAEVKFLRYALPLSIPLALGVGYAMGEGHRMKGRGMALVALGILGIGGVDGGGLRGAIGFDANMASVDPREQAVAWSRDPAHKVTTVGVPNDPWFWTPPFYPDTGLPRAFTLSQREALRRESHNPQVLQASPRQWQNRQSWDAALFDLKPEYICYSDFESAGLERLSKLANVPDDHMDEVVRYKLFMARLKRDYSPAVSFGPGVEMVEDMRYANPTIYLWKRKG